MWNMRVLITGCVVLLIFPKVFASKLEPTKQKRDAPIVEKDGKFGDPVHYPFADHMGAIDNNKNPSGVQNWFHQDHEKPSSQYHKKFQPVAVPYPTSLSHPQQIKHPILFSHPQQIDHNPARIPYPKQSEFNPHGLESPIQIEHPTASVTQYPSPIGHSIEQPIAHQIGHQIEEPQHPHEINHSI